MAALLLVSIGLVMRASQGGIDVYLLGDWPSRLGIVLMLDRLGALMVLVTTLLMTAVVWRVTGFGKVD